MPEKFCKDCRHYVNINNLDAPYRHDLLYKYGASVCRVQLHLVELKTNLVTGLQEPVDNWRMSCDTQREQSFTIVPNYRLPKENQLDICGREGKYWEPKQVIEEGETK